MRAQFFRLAVLSLLVSALSPAPASAQYMFLDSNADGVHTAADEVNPIGTTTIDVWLDTGENRDATDAECPDSGDPHEFFSYLFCLRVSDGTVAWGPFENAQATMGVHFGRRTSSTEYVDGYGGLTEFPPARYRLGRLVMTTLSGTPRVEIVANTSLSFEITSFGSTCVGSQFDNTMRMGVEWGDVDGLPFGSGGTVNTPPILSAASPMSVLEGAFETRSVFAMDPDGQQLVFSKASGPDFFHVSTLDRAGGVGELFAFPRAGNAGQYEGGYQVSDGIATASRTVSVTAIPGPGHPPVMKPVPTVTAVTEQVVLVEVSASDPDGDALTFALDSGPPYASIETLRSGSGGALGRLRVAPGFCDVGDARARVTVSDGRFTQGVDVSLHVVPHGPAPAEPVKRAVTTKFPVGVVVGDLNADGHLDAVTSSFELGVSIFNGTGDGTMNARNGLDNIPGGPWPAAIASGNLNGDPYMDVVIANFVEPTFTVLMGRATGTLERGKAFAAGIGPSGVSLADMNGDGHTDVVVSNTGSHTISVHLGTGDGTFLPMRETFVGDSPLGSAVADLNLDGIMDVAVANQRSGTVSVLLGIGNGFFRPRNDIAVGFGPVAVSAGDLDGDGIAELVVSNYVGGQLQLLPGRGDGTFQSLVPLPVLDFARPQLVAIGDLDLDGLPDLVVAEVNRGFFLRNGGGLTFSEAVALPPAFGVAIGDLNEDGFPDIALSNEASFGEIWSMLTIAGGRGGVAARTFTTGSSQKVTLGNEGGPDVCIRVEPIGGSYENAQVDLASFTLTSPGTGSVEMIHSVAAKRAVEDDTDRNGVTEIPACFEPGDVSRLFDTVRGNQVVSAKLQGSLLDGRPFCTTVTLKVGGKGQGALAANVSPNPLNPRATLRFTTTREGAVTIRMYDLHGRVVRTLLQRPLLPAGSHEVEVHGRSQNGQSLASGVYFYEVEAAEGRVRGRLTILK